MAANTISAVGILRLAKEGFSGEPTEEMLAQMRLEFKRRGLVPPPGFLDPDL